MSKLDDLIRAIDERIKNKQSEEERVLAENRKVAEFAETLVKGFMAYLGSQSTDNYVIRVGQRIKSHVVKPLPKWEKDYYHFDIELVLAQYTITLSFEVRKATNDYRMEIYPVGKPEACAPEMLSSPTPAGFPLEEIFDILEKRIADWIA
jgi:hypothetical protein